MNTKSEDHPLKIFISYSHIDEKDISDFQKHITPLKDNKLIDDWYDRKIIAGENWRNEIDNNLDDADIICLIISKNFIDSPNCKKEKDNAFDLKKKKGIVVVPIILSSCMWKEYEDLNTVEALPTDGVPVLNFPKTTDDAWCNVCDGLKKVVKKVNKIKDLIIKKEFLDFLKDVELLTKASSEKESIYLEDIFIYPELSKFNDLMEFEKIESSEKIIENFNKNTKILIAGEDQSGKTTLAKKLFMELRSKNFVPVYISNKPNPIEGNIENKIIKKLIEQYENFSKNEIDKQRIIPIIDDFHLIKNKEKYIQTLSKYYYLIVFVDDIYSLNIKDENIRKKFTHYKLNEFKPSLRYALIEKWTKLTDIIDNKDNSENQIYHNIDQRVELVNILLGKIIGSGIMPSYPFFILSVMTTYETFQKPLDQEITSQGYCYQALIYLFLRKQGVKNDEIDTYINFLTEFAFYLFKEKKLSLSKDEYDFFMNIYKKKYNFPIKEEKLLKKLYNTKLISFDNFDNISFHYSYIYYFFVAKYLSEHQEENRKLLTNIVNNLHKNENAYIAIFMIHHSKNTFILNQILGEATKLFKKFKPSTLSKSEVNFFDKQTDILVNAVLPPYITPEKARAERLKTQDMVEKIKENDNHDENDIDDFKEFRRSLRTVEVMGQIIKNRHSSLEKDNLKNIFIEAMRVHLRIMNSFFKYIQDKDQQQDIIDFISERLDKYISEKGKKPDKDELKKISREIFWNVNMFFIYGLIYKTVHSLGSDKLVKGIISPICDDENTPASFLIKHGILMTYTNNFQIDNISKKFKDKKFSEIAKKIMKFQIVNYCATRKINYVERQKIESIFEIPRNKLPHYKNDT